MIGRNLDRVNLGHVVQIMWAKCSRSNNAGLKPWDTYRGTNIMKICGSNGVEQI